MKLWMLIKTGWRQATGLQRQVAIANLMLAFSGILNLLAQFIPVLRVAGNAIEFVMIAYLFILAWWLRQQVYERLRQEAFEQLGVQLQSLLVAVEELEKVLQSAVHFDLNHVSTRAFVLRSYDALVLSLYAEIRATRKLLNQYRG